MQKYTLIITEKPDAAKRIAQALDTNGKPTQMKEKGVPYYVANRDKQLLIVPSLGHLYTVAQDKGTRTQYPIFTYHWVPRYEAERNANQTRTWINMIATLAANADMFIDACDYDVEGSIVGYSILKHACSNKESIAKRMKYSTLTKEELEQSYAQALPRLDFALIEAGLTRHEIDWLYGINLSRALTSAAKEHSGSYATLSTGRVQGPTLHFLATREKTIKTHVPTPYWKIAAQLMLDGRVFEAEYEKPIIATKKEAETIQNDCKDKDGTAEKIETRQFQQPPPNPFDIGSLQSEAYNLFGYTPKRTLDIAQHLYLDALISYPRTSSQKLPATIGYRQILRNLNKISQYNKLTEELLAKPQLSPREGIREDPAHPAIYPTGKKPERELTEPERRIYDLIAKRFMATSAEPALRQTAKVTINVNTHHFYLKGIQTLKEGWLRFYQPYVRTKEILLPKTSEKQTIPIQRISIEDKFTKPPPRYNPKSLLEKMENSCIGTKATRADIIQTLYQRKYIRDEKINVTDLGFEVTQVLENHCPTIISTEMTKNLEEEMENIRANKEKKEQVLAKAIEILEPVLEKLKNNEKEIGKQLANAIRKAKLEERIIGTCHACGSGNTIILHSRKTGKRFLGCTNYFTQQCTASFPLPQKGTLKPLNRNCHSCGWPLIQVRTKERRPWNLCYNPSCPSKKE